MTDPCEKKRKRFEATLQGQMEQYQFEPPIEPEEETVVGRILSPEKFIRFLARPGIYLSPPRCYDDPRDGSFPSGVIVAHKQGLKDHMNQSGLSNGEDNRFRVKVHQMFANASGVKYPLGAASCWTVVEPEGASDLTWRHYAGGRNGVGIKTSYSLLKSIFSDLLNEGDGQEYLISGYVEYTEDELQRHPAFRKRPEFSPEKEVRFFAPEVQEARLLKLFGPASCHAFETFYSHDIDTCFEMHTRELIQSQCPQFFVRDRSVGNAVNRISAHPVKSADSAPAWSRI